MKNLIIPFLIGGLILTAGIQSASAQTQLKEVIISSKSGQAAIYKKVSTAFSTLFRDAKEPKWFEIDKKYIVIFMMDDKKNKALFTENGDLVYHLVYGDEKDTPDDILSIVKNKYRNYTINSSVKVNVEGKTVWIINMQDPKAYYVVRIENEDVDVIERMRRS